MMEFFLIFHKNTFFLTNPSIFNDCLPMLCPPLQENQKGEQIFGAENCQGAKVKNNYCLSSPENIFKMTISTQKVYIQNAMQAIQRNTSYLDSTLRTYYAISFRDETPTEKFFLARGKNAKI